MGKKQVDVTSAKLADRNNYVNTLRKIVAEDICPFCEENISRHHPNPILFKNKDWVVTTNAWPYPGTKYHFLLISRHHIEAIEKGPDSMWLMLQRAYKRLCKDFKLAGSSLVMRSGDTAYTGATVRHLHAQIIVGRKRTSTSAPITAVVGYKKNNS